jgi:hypothetical protein
MFNVWIVDLDDEDGDRLSSEFFNQLEDFIIVIYDSSSEMKQALISKLLP